MPETAAFRGWKAQDAIEWFHGIGRLVHGRKNFFAEARGFLNVENSLNPAVFLEGSADSVERIVAMAWLAPFIEKGEMGQGKFFLGLRPKEWRVLASPFLLRFVKRGDGFF